jgi:hypothetical protein
MAKRFGKVTWQDLVSWSLFAGIASLLMARVWANWSTQLYGAFGDNAIYVYMAEWMLRALSQGQSPFFDPYLNYPDGMMLTATDVPYAHLLAATPITAFFGAISTYNCIMWLSHFLSGLIPYLWIRRLTGSHWGGVVAGLAFMLTPYRMVHGNGHLNLVSTHVLPLFFWALDSVLVRQKTTQRLSRRSLCLLGLATFYVGSTSQYYLAICVLSGLVYTLFFVRPLAHLKRLWPLLPTVLGCAVLSSLPYLAMLRSGTFHRSHITESRDFSASPLHFLFPSSSHPLWGASVTEWFGIRDSELTIYLGVVALLLAYFAVRGQQKTDDHATETSLATVRQRAWIAVGLMAAILAMGTDLHVGYDPISIDNPLWLPAYYIGQLPFAGIMRVWSRFGVISVFFIALSAGIGAAKIATQVGEKRRCLVMLGCIFALLLDLLPSPGTPITLKPRPIDLWLAYQTGDSAVAVLPPSLRVEPITEDIYGSLWHRKPMPATVHPKHMPMAYRRFRHIAREFPAPDSIQNLRTLGFRFLILDTTRFNGGDGPKWQEVQEQLKQNPVLRPVAQVPPFVVMEWAKP